MNNKLYIYKRPVKEVNNHSIVYEYLLPHNSKHFFWTMCSGDSDYCANYRITNQRKYIGMKLDEITKIDCKDEMDCKNLQLSINTVFKPWAGKQMRLIIDMTDDDFINIVNRIYNNEDMHMLTSELISKYEHPIKSGWVYLVKCANNKLKIGVTEREFESRFEELKNEERNQAIEAIEVRHSNDILLEEAELHLLCSEFKVNGNAEVTWLQEYGNSELFKDCQDVINIWREYKVNRDIRNNNVTM